MPTDEALVLDNVGDCDAIAEAFGAGRSVVVPCLARGRRAALARPEVAAVLVPNERRDLLELDLTELTYGDPVVATLLDRRL